MIENIVQQTIQEKTQEAKEKAGKVDKQALLQSLQKQLAPYGDQAVKEALNSSKQELMKQSVTEQEYQAFVKQMTK